MTIINQPTNYIIEQKAFKKTFRKWRKKCSLSDPCSVSLYPFWNLEYFEGKVTKARLQCQVPSEDTLFLLYDKTFMSTTEVCTIIGRFGIYSYETDKAFFYAARETVTTTTEEGERRRTTDKVPCNFTPWNEFFGCKLLSREGKRIFLDGKYFLHGYNNCKLFFSFLCFLYDAFSSSYPFNFVTCNPSVRVGQLLLEEEDLEIALLVANDGVRIDSGRKKVKTFSQLSNKKKTILSRFHMDFTPEQIMLVYFKGSSFTVLTTMGIYLVDEDSNARTCCCSPLWKRGTSSPTTTTTTTTRNASNIQPLIISQIMNASENNNDSNAPIDVVNEEDEIEFIPWKDLVQIRTLMLSSGFLHFNDKIVTRGNMELFHLLSHILLILCDKSHDDDVAPPSYEQLTPILSSVRDFLNEDRSSSSSGSMSIIIPNKKIKNPDVFYPKIPHLLIAQQDTPPIYSASFESSADSLIRANSFVPSLLSSRSPHPPPYASQMVF